MALPELLFFIVGLLPWQQHVRQHHLQHASPSLRPNTSDVSVLLVRQRLDHFDQSERRAWSQRVFVRSTFFNGSGPVFLCVGGEGPPLDASVLVASPHCNDAVELAPSVGALLVAAEHRFYGPTADVRPLPSFDTGALRFLSSSQAVEDLIGVHETVSLTLGLGGRNRWVAFGGSYPGMMAGFARLKLPHLFHAAVSSSAPWQAVVDMPQYNDVVSDALANPSVGGSAECASAVADGHAHLLALLGSAAGRRSLEVLFHMCEPAALERTELALAWAGGGAITVPAQANEPGCAQAGCDIASVCALLADKRHAGATPRERVGPELALKRLAAVSAAQRDGKCVPTSELDPETAMAELLNSSSAARAWPYQTCAEFGFFQTCELGSRCPFARGALPLRPSLEMCEKAFGIGGLQAAANVAGTNRRYGGSSPAASRVLFVNGNVDPWSALGVLRSPDGNRSEPVFLARGASHHAWTHPADSIVQPSVRAAKELVWRQVERWLSEPYVS